MKALFRLRVRDFDRFVSAVDSIISSQECGNITIYRDSDDPSEAVLMAWDIDRKQLQQFFDSPEFDQYAQRVGLMADPEVTFLEEARSFTPTHH